MTNRVSLAELSSAEIRLRPAEAVAIVAEVCRQNLAPAPPGIPSPDRIHLLPDGRVAIDRDVRAPDDDVTRAATLLNGLLPGVEATPEFRASGGLRLLVARALGTLDLPPFQSLEEFTVALSRFTTLDAHETAAGLFRAWEVAQSVTRQVSAAVPPAPNRWAWAAGTVALLVISAFAGWKWADSPSVPPAPPATTRPSIDPAASAASAQLSSSAAAQARPHQSGRSPRVIRASAYSPAFGPGAALYFHEQQGGASVLKVAQTGATGEITRVSSIVDDRALNFHPRPSPDGSRIAFDSDRDGTRAVFVAAADGSRAQRISGSGYAAVPSWSPDGTRVAFVRAEPNAPDVWNVWVAAPDGTQLHRLTRHRVGQAWGASWFPDGRRVAYSVETRLAILDLATGRTQTFYSPRPGRLLRTPAVSPDGGRIIFQVYREGAWLLDLDTRRMRRVLADPTAEEFTWAPEGDRVAFHSRRSGAWSVWMMAL